MGTSNNGGRNPRFAQRMEQQDEGTKGPNSVGRESISGFLEMREEDKSKVKEALENELLPEEARFQAI